MYKQFMSEYGLKESDTERHSQIAQLMGQKEGLDPLFKIYSKIHRTALSIASAQCREV